MKKTLITLNAVTLALSSVLSGCANMDDTQRRTGTGAAIGAAAGAVIGAATASKKDRGKGAAIGAAAGAALGAGGGYLWSKRMQEQQAAMEQAASRYYTSLGWDKCSPPIEAGPVVDVNSKASSFTAFQGGLGSSTSTWNSQQLPWNASWNGQVWIVSFTAAPGNCPISVMGAG